MYQAIYRKYRPMTFTEMMGQEHITTTLKNQILKGNIGHAYLFSGTRGTGKTSAAKIFSRAVNCLNPQDGNPCNECHVCKGILDESIMDVIEMDAASNNSVEDIRDLKEKVIYPPSIAKHKVYIIDEVHMLSKGAFNALLKTLEEPPKHLIFILATTEPERLPQTILSRCQRFEFKRLINKDIIENMKNIASKMSVNIDEKALSLIARNSDGAMRDALSLMDQCISFKNDNISYEDATNILGITNKLLIHDLVEFIKDKELERVLVKIDEIIQDGKDINIFIRDLIQYYRDLMIAKTANNPAELLDIDEVDGYTSQVRTLSLHNILKSLDVLTEAQTQSKWSTQPRIILEMAAIKLLKVDDELSLEERVRRLEEGNINIPKKENIAPRAKVEQTNNEVKHEFKKQIENKEVVIEQKEEKNEQTSNQSMNNEGSLDLNTVIKEWPKVLQNIKAKKVSLFALIMEGKIGKVENNMISIVYDEGFGFHKEAMSKPQNKDIIEEIASGYFNMDLEVRFFMKDELPKAGLMNENQSKEDGQVQKVVDFFGEDIVKIK